MGHAHVFVPAAPPQHIALLDSHSSSLISGLASVRGRPPAPRTLGFDELPPAKITDACWPVMCWSSLSANASSESVGLISSVSLESSLMESLFLVLVFVSRGDVCDASSVFACILFFRFGISFSNLSANLCMATTDDGAKMRRSGRLNVVHGHKFDDIQVS